MGSLRCFYCDKYHENWDSLHEHYRIVHYLLPCSKCNKYFLSEELDSHFKICFSTPEVKGNTGCQSTSANQQECCNDYNTQCMETLYCVELERIINNPHSSPFVKENTSKTNVEYSIPCSSTSDKDTAIKNNCDELKHTLSGGLSVREHEVNNEPEDASIVNASTKQNISSFITPDKNIRTNNEFKCTSTADSFFDQNIPSESIITYSSTPNKGPYVNIFGHYTNIINPLVLCSNLSKASNEFPLQGFQKPHNSIGKEVNKAVFPRPFPNYPYKLCNKTTTVKMEVRNSSSSANIKKNAEKEEEFLWGEIFPSKYDGKKQMLRKYEKIENRPKYEPSSTFKYNFPKDCIMQHTILLKRLLCDLYVCSENEKKLMVQLECLKDQTLALRMSKLRMLAFPKFPYTFPRIYIKFLKKILGKQVIDIGLKSYEDAFLPCPVKEPQRSKKNKLVLFDDSERESELRKATKTILDFKGCNSCVEVEDILVCELNKFLIDLCVKLKNSENKKDPLDDALMYVGMGGCKTVKDFYAKDVIETHVFTLRRCLRMYRSFAEHRIEMKRLIARCCKKQIIVKKQPLQRQKYFHKRFGKTGLKPVISRKHKKSSAKPRNFLRCMFETVHERSEPMD